MDASSDARPTTRSSRIKGGVMPGSWRRERVFSASKICENCGAVFHPFGLAMREHLWKKQRFCSISCARKKENPMRDPAAVARMAATLRRIGHKPKKRGGNGQGFTSAQHVILNWLDSDWIPEFVVPTLIPRGSGYPTCYKVDVANPKEKIAIELDGYSHSGKRLAADRKKDALLTSLGWHVFRLKNADALKMCTISRSPDTLLITLTEYSYITATSFPITSKACTARPSRRCANSCLTCVSSD